MLNIPRCTEQLLARLFGPKCGTKILRNLSQGGRTVTRFRARFLKCQLSKSITWSLKESVLSVFPWKFSWELWWLLAVGCSWMGCRLKSLFVSLYLSSSSSFYFDSNRYFTECLTSFYFAHLLLAVEGRSSSHLPRSSLCLGASGIAHRELLWSTIHHWEAFF